MTLEARFWIEALALTVLAFAAPVSMALLIIKYSHKNRK